MDYKFQDKNKTNIWNVYGKRGKNKKKNVQVEVRKWQILDLIEDFAN